MPYVIHKGTGHRVAILAEDLSTADEQALIESIAAELDYAPYDLMVEDEDAS